MAKCDGCGKDLKEFARCGDRMVCGACYRKIMAGPCPVCGCPFEPDTGRLEDELPCELCEMRRREHIVIKVLEEAL